MEYPLISIIVPVYNVENYIDKCLQSILNQSYENLEVLLIDDGSVDHSGEICDDYARMDKRIRVFHQINKGVSSARNKGLELSAGKYIVFIDADDYVKPDYLEILYGDMEEYQVDIVSCELVPVVEGKQTDDRHTINYKRVISNQNELYDSYRQQEQFYRNVTGKLILREAAVKHTFKNLKFGEDTVYMLEVLSEDVSIYLDTYPGYFYVRREGSTVTGSSKFNVRRNMDHVHIGKTFYDGAQKCSQRNQVYALEEYSGYVYNVISYIIKQKDKKSYINYGAFLKNHVSTILGDGRLKGKRKYMLTFYDRAPKIYWGVMCILLKMKMKLDGESVSY